MLVTGELNFNRPACIATPFVIILYGCNPANRITAAALLRLKNTLVPFLSTSKDCLPLTFQASSLSRLPKEMV